MIRSRRWLVHRRDQAVDHGGEDAADERVVEEGHGHVVGYLVVHDVAVDQLDPPGAQPVPVAVDVGARHLVQPCRQLNPGHPVEWVPHGRLEDDAAHAGAEVDEHVVGAYRPARQCAPQGQPRCGLVPHPVRCRDASSSSSITPEVRIP